VSTLLRGADGVTHERQTAEQAEILSRQSLGTSPGGDDGEDHAALNPVAALYSASRCSRTFLRFRIGEPIRK